MGMKIQGIRGSFTLTVKRWVIGRKICRDIQLGTYRASEGCKLGSKVLFVGFDFGIYGGMHVFIDGGKIGVYGGTHVFIDGGKIDTKLPHFLLGLCEIRGQRIEASFQVFAMGVGHDENEKGKVGPHRKWVIGEVYHDD
jgi:hypothetical protein